MFIRSHLGIVHFLFVVALLVAVLGLVGCSALTGALPPSPSPFPTLARLPSVTPMPPTAPPAPTRVAASPTPEAAARSARVTAFEANVRLGPGTTFAVVTIVGVGQEVVLRSQNQGWYEVTTPDGKRGWMAALVLDVDPDLAAAVPTVTP